MTPPSDRDPSTALVVGATGHLGNAVVRDLLDSGWRITTTSRQGVRAANLAGLDIDHRRVGDDGFDDVCALVAGHRLVVDAAAPYHLWLGEDSNGSASHSPAQRRMAALLEACRIHDACFVHVSSFTTLARQRTWLGTLQRNALEVLHPYFAHKAAMEERVLEAASRVRSIIVNPTMCLGPWDLKAPELCLIPLLALGRVPATNGHELNVIDVRDVARAIRVAFEQACFGRQIPLTGHNTTVDALTASICRRAGVAPPTRNVPAALTSAAFYGNELLSRAGLSPVAYPAVGAMLLLEQSWEQPSPAQRRLGIAPMPLSRTLADSIDWYREQGYLDGAVASP
ncbi:MAG: NAD-dependent epimerase/dehydratase family protein [Pseudomonadales bacterium]